MAKSPSKNSLKAKYAALSTTNQSLVKFLAITSILILLGLLYHFNTDQNIESTERFFEQRKTVQDFHQYQQDEEDAKKRAEKNIFLQ